MCGANARLKVYVQMHPLWCIWTCDFDDAGPEPPLNLKPSSDRRRCTDEQQPPPLQTTGTNTQLTTTVTTAHDHTTSCNLVPSTNASFGHKLAPYRH